MIKQVVGILVLAGAISQSAIAQGAATDYPSGPVRIIAPIVAGGGVDVVARALAARLSGRWKQPVIVDNRPGASGGIGASAVEKAKPDGLTLMAAHDAVLVANKYLVKTLPYNIDKAFAPVAMLVQANQMFLATPSTPANDLKELVNLVKREPGKFSYGSYGVGTQPQLAYETLNKREGLDIVHVPYKGVAAVINAMMGNEVQLSMGSAAVAGQLINAGKLKPLALAGKQRDPAFPNVKTTAELGFPYLQVSIWHALYAPADTPPAIVDRIAADVRAILKDPDFAKQVQGFTILDGGPKELADRIREETARAQEMVRAAGIKAE